MSQRKIADLAENLNDEQYGVLQRIMDSVSPSGILLVIAQDAFRRIGGIDCDSERAAAEAAELAIRNAWRISRNAETVLRRDVADEPEDDSE